MQLFASFVPRYTHGKIANEGVRSRDPFNHIVRKPPSVPERTLRGRPCWRGARASVGGEHHRAAFPRSAGDDGAPRGSAAHILPPGPTFPGVIGKFRATFHSTSRGERTRRAARPATSSHLSRSPRRASSISRIVAGDTDVGGGTR